MARDEFVRYCCVHTAITVDWIFLITVLMVMVGRNIVVVFVVCNVAVVSEGVMVGFVESLALAIAGWNM